MDIISYYISSVQFSCSVVFDPLQPHGLQHTRPPCPSPTPGVYPNSCPLSQWCHPTISSSVVSFLSRLQSFILGTCWPREFIFQCPIFLPFILFMGFSRQEYWSGLPFPSPVDQDDSEQWSIFIRFLHWIHMNTIVYKWVEVLSCHIYNYCIMEKLYPGKFFPIILWHASCFFLFYFFHFKRFVWLNLYIFLLKTTFIYCIY